MSRYYLGSFPPEYGGVTIKNQNLYNSIKEKISIDKVDFSKIKRKNIPESIRLVKAIFNRKNVFVIGVAGKKTRRKFCKLLYYVNAKAMQRSIIFLMGGVVANDIANDSTYRKYIKKFKKVYVETQGMKKTLEDAGLNNISIYPNARFAPENKIYSDMNKIQSDRFRCVFFSLINDLKGVTNILEAATTLPYMDFVFYGVIEDEYKQYFLKQVEKHSNVYYKGVFNKKEAELYKELVQYDVLLLPTKYKTEGVPGILVESKIAGIPAVVSNVCYNAEIIKNGIDGIVLQENTVECLIDVLKYLYQNLSVLKKMRDSSVKNASQYYIENYIDDIVNELK